jgi:hypothetical protein
MNKNHKPFFISNYSRASFLPALGLQVIKRDKQSTVRRGYFS